MLENRNLSNSSSRTLDIFFKLLTSEQEKEELLSEFSEDSLSIYLETLKRVGIKIEKNKKTKKYSIVENINLLNFNSQDSKNFAKIKTLISNKTSIENIIDFNNLLCNLAQISDTKTKNNLLEIANDLPFGPDWHSKILFLEECIKSQTNIKLIYNSPRVGLEEFLLLPVFLKVNNSKLYLWAKDNYLPDIRCFRLDKIISIEKTKEAIKEVNLDNFAICELVAGFDLKKLDKEKIEIIEQNNERIKIKLFYLNTFELLQKVLKLGNECKILEPTEFQEKLTEQLKQIRSLYE